MNDKSHHKLESSLSIDELLSLTDRRHPPNWLLIYIDVFVLIIMLVITLVALSNFDAQKAPDNQTAPIRPVPNIQKAVETPPPQTTKQSEQPEEIAKQLEPPAENTELEALAKTQSTNPPAAKPDESKQSPTEVKPEQPAEQTIQQHLHQQLDKLGLSDSIHMTVTQGYAQLEIQDNILYQSSQAILTDSGRSILARLTPLLKQAEGLIYIEGHTDDRPIKTSLFPSNWELGAARATSALHFLASQQIDVTRMRAVTYAHTKPIADNSTEQGRQKNRRVNIVIKVSDKVD